MGAILAMVDSMPFATFGTIPSSLNPCGFQGFGIDMSSYKSEGIIRIEIGHEGFDRKLLIDEFEKKLFCDY